MDKKYTVLLVDDDKFLLEMYKKKFDLKAAKVDLAIGSTEVLERLRLGEKPDIIVLDIIMPVMDGIELLGIIRKEKLSPASVIVVLSNESDRSKIERAKALGVSGYIVKATSNPSDVVDEVIKIADLKSKK